MSDKSEHPLFMPYCLIIAGAGVVLLVLITQIWTSQLPLFSGSFWLLILLDILIGSFGFFLGKNNSIHVSLSSAFEIALLLSLGPLLTVWVSALSVSGSYLLR